jgi:hypothetical protein
LRVILFQGDTQVTVNIKRNAIAIAADLAFIAAATLLAHPAAAQRAQRPQRPEKNIVVVDATPQANDILGKLMITDLLDDIARSPRWRQDAAETGQFGTTLTVHLVTDDTADHTETNVSEVITINSYYLSSAVIHCPAAKVAACAKEIMPDFDDTLRSIRVELDRQNGRLQPLQPQPVPAPAPAQ